MAEVCRWQVVAVEIEETAKNPTVTGV